MKLEIQIGPRSSVLNAAARISVLIGSALAIPVINELILNGHWSINIIGALFGTIAAIAVFKASLPTSRIFPNKEAAAEWVLSGDWDRTS